MITSPFSDSKRTTSGMIADVERASKVVSRQVKCFLLNEASYSTELRLGNAGGLISNELVTIFCDNGSIYETKLLPLPWLNPTGAEC